MTSIENLHPRFLYGTAWKEERSAELTFQALQAGFRGIDTANQRKHYNEEGVGQGIKKFLELKTAQREDLFLQTKFTFARGQDHRLPYNLKDKISQQVADSFASSLVHLHTNYLDSYVLHGPYGNGIQEQDLEAWAAMEKLLENKQVKYLGISNIEAEQLSKLCETVKIKPQFVQNRCYARTAWDQDIREICKSNGITYQGFSLLTANRTELSLPQMTTLAKKHNKTVSQIVFRFAQQIKMLPLTGTTNLEHMQQDLQIDDFELSPSEVASIEFNQV